MLRAVQAAMGNGKLVVRNLTLGLPSVPKLLDARIYPLKPGAMIISYEVTERETLREQTATIRRAAAIEQLARKMTHELRNPLHTMGLNLELLADELVSLPEESKEESSEIIVSLKKQIQRLSEIIDSYKDAAKMPPLNLVETDVKKIIMDLAHFFKGEASSRGIAIEVECDEGVPHLFLDTNYIREAILNLIRNAFEAMPQGGTLTICAMVEDEQILIQVKDTGIGIEKEQQKKLFDFAYSTKKEGSGVGLQLIKQIIELHGGSLHVESEPKKGSIFTLRFPWARNLKEEKEELASLSSDAEVTNQLPDVEIIVLQVGENSTLVGNTLAQIDLRKKYGVNVLTIHRGSEILSNVGGEVQICADDVLSVVGVPGKIAEVVSLLNNPGD